MFESAEVLDAHVRDSLHDNRFYSKQSWVAPAVARDGAKIHDVVIVGAGQNGLALAFNLKLRGVRRIVVVDAQDRDKPGPWSSFARMPQLRTPKSIPGPDCGNPLLRFKTWFCSAYSATEYESFEFIPLKYWREYLAWFRGVLDIDTVNNTTITDIEWDAEDGCLRLRAQGPDADTSVFAARKLCLATGMTAAGRWAAPESLTARLPRSTYFCAWEEIPWPELAGRDVAVVGAGASGLDNASWALDSGCRSVTVIGRSVFPKKDLYFELWRGRDDSEVFPEVAGSLPADILDPLLAYNAGLSDTDRLRLFAGLFKHGRSPANPEYLARVRNLDRMRVLEGWPVERLDYIRETGKVRIQGNGEELDVDQVIFATGPQGGLQYRPELKRLLGEALTWGDRIGAGDPVVRDLDTYPKLTAHFQLQPRAGDGEELGNIYCLADLIHNTVGLQSLQHTVTTVAGHIASSLYREQLSGNVSLIEELIGG